MEILRCWGDRSSEEDPRLLRGPYEFLCLRVREEFRASSSTLTPLTIGLSSKMAVSGVLTSVQTKGKVLHDLRTVS